MGSKGSIIICPVCNDKFPAKKVNSRYCSIRCRRKVEIMRRLWDTKKEYIERAEGFATSPKLEQSSRDHWTAWVKAAKERLGGRP